MSQNSQIVPILRNKRFQPISGFESKMIDKSKLGFYVSVKVHFVEMTSFLRNWPFLFKRMLIIKKFKCHHIALNTLHSRHKYREMVEQNAFVMTV